MTYQIFTRVAIPGDATLIGAHRHAMFAAMGHDDEALLDAMEVAFVRWVRPRLESGEYRGWFAVNERGEVVAGAGLWIMDWPPHMLDLGERRGNIVNVYTQPAYQRQGLARRLMDEVLAWCNANALHVIILHASEQGRSLYAALGFVPTNEMRLQLPILEKGQ